MVDKSGDKPQYSLATVKKLVRQGAYRLVTRNAREDFAELGFSTKQFVAVIEALMNSHFRGVHPDCHAGRNLVMDCDSYCIEIDRDLLAPRRGGGTDLYLKFAVADTGQLIAFFSCHD